MTTNKNFFFLDACDLYFAEEFFSKFRRKTMIDNTKSKENKKCVSMTSAEEILIEFILLYIHTLSSFFLILCSTHLAEKKVVCCLAVNNHFAIMANLVLKAKS